MTINDLKTGMIVILANGKEYMIYKGAKTTYYNGDVLVATDGSASWDELWSYNTDLTKINRVDKDLDIVKVIEVPHPYAFIKPGYDSQRRKVLWSKKKTYTYAQLREILGEEFEVVG